MRIIGAGGRDDIEYRELETFWTLPNLITVLRFGLVPVFVVAVVADHYAWATIVLVILGGTDWIDGYVARRLNQISTVGKWLDPVADRVALIVVVIVFVVDGIAPAWLVYSIVIPDAVLIVNALVLFHGSPNLPVNTLGKIRTALLLVGTPLLLLGQVDASESDTLQALATLLLGIGCLLHVVAAVIYFRQARRKARTLRSGGTWSG
ncbi:CDP-alcohol phosphatidyltransferase family protein [Arthrobacter sp. JSM 101049]|uniref:CDP-alcohol phosphatidyltransferase family protein n=1 Tax=Arthrobacter sp. JSM 101049 TaxID=929097 RepID=UPI0035652E0F